MGKPMLKAMNRLQFYRYFKGLVEEYGIHQDLLDQYYIQYKDEIHRLEAEESVQQ